MYLSRKRYGIQILCKVKRITRQVILNIPPSVQAFKPQLPIGYSWQKQDGGTHSSIHKFVYKNRAQSDLTFFPGQG